MRIRKLLRVRFVVDPFIEQEKIMAELTPMMQKYMETKEQYKDCILFYRLGDFYEMFFDDALVASKELEITLTGKSCGLEERAPMCGIPYHAVEGYLSKLRMYGAFMENRLVGVIATRSEGAHIALFFVKGEYHGRGIGSQLFKTVDSGVIT
jgi:GNAT superfamily N-acetyltransferase